MNPISDGEDSSNYSWIFPYIQRPIQNIVEVGSRDLLDAIQLSQYFGANVIAFEPDERAIRICKKNIRGYESTICLVTQALGDKDGYEDLYVYELGSSSLYKHKWATLSRKESVSTKRFDSLDYPTPNMVVMDVQGSEFKVLSGFGEELRKIKYLCFESSFYSAYENQECWDDINRFLVKNGFRFIASNVSGKGKIRFLIMRLRGVFFQIRKNGLRGFRSYSGFFDVLYSNTLM